MICAVLPIPTVSATCEYAYALCVSHCYWGGRTSSCNTHHAAARVELLYVTLADVHRHLCAWRRRVAGCACGTCVLLSLPDLDTSLYLTHSLEGAPLIVEQSAPEAGRLVCHRHALSRERAG